MHAGTAGHREIQHRNRLAPDDNVHEVMSVQTLPDDEQDPVLGEACSSTT